KDKMLNTLLILLAMGFGFAVQADPVDYYEPHLTISTPIGTVEYGRSLHKGGWAYGYDVFNKPFESSLLQVKLSVSTFTSNTLTVKADLLTDGKGVVERTQLLSCHFAMQWQSERYLLSDFQCGNRQPASQYLPAKNHLHLGLAATTDEVQQGIIKILDVYGNAMHTQMPNNGIKVSTTFDIKGAQEYIPVRIYDSVTGLIYHYDSYIRAVQKQNSDPIYIEWDNNSSATTNLLVPERINDAAGNTLLSFNNTTVNNSGIITRVPLTVTDYEGRKVQYEYDSDRLTKRIDPLGNEWLYQYQDYRPERAPQAVLKRLHTIKD